MLNSLCKYGVNILLILFYLAPVAGVGLLIYYYWSWVLIIGGGILLIWLFFIIMEEFSSSSGPSYTNYTLRSDHKYEMRKGKVYRKR